MERLKENTRSPERQGDRDGRPQISTQSESEGEGKGNVGDMALQKSRLEEQCELHKISVNFTM